MKWKWMEGTKNSLIKDSVPPLSEKEISDGK